MAKLYFRHGAVGSAKTLNLLAVAHAYEQQDKNVFLIKPRLDDRFGMQSVRSRAGLQREADLLADNDTDLLSLCWDGVHCILVDEVQFLSANLIEQLRAVTVRSQVPAICYGLRTDFRRELFPGSKRLLELADAVEEIKTTCAYCTKKAIFNLKLVEGKPTKNGPTIELGAEERYLPVCAECYDQKLLAFEGVPLSLGTESSSINIT